MTPVTAKALLRAEPVAGLQRSGARTTWETTAAYTVLFVLAAALGRMFQDNRISILWPAAGVIVLWVLARGRAPRRWIDLCLLCAGSLTAALLTGSNAYEAVTLVVSQSTQAIVSLALLNGSRTLRSGRGQRALRHVEDLWLLVATALVASGAAALATQLMLQATPWALPWSSLGLRAVRNAASVLVIVPVGLALVEWAQTPPRRRPARPSRLRVGRIAEHTTALALVPLTYMAWFWLEDVPLIFPLIILTVWAGARLRTWFVLLHDTVAAVTAVAYTIAGSGPFVAVGEGWVEIVLAQLYVGIVCTIGLALALARDERVRLARDAARSRDAARAQAELLSTVVDTMTEGVSVVAADGRIVLRNPRAIQLLGTTPAEHGLHRIDGEPLPDDELPYRRGMAEGELRELLLRRVSPQGETRILSFNTTRLPDRSSGVVSVIRDVTVERRELERAAQVQERLSPEHMPTVPGYEVAARVLSAGMVGGDFYDWSQADGLLTIVLADVMGKGLGAAILAASARTALRVRPQGASLGVAVSAAEATITDDLRRTGAFVTGFVAQLDHVSHRLDYVDAGHGLSFVARAATGEVERLPATGPPLGILSDVSRTTNRTTLDPGDLLVAVSDGMLDALGGSIEDLAGVEAVLRGDGSAEQVVDALLALVPDEREVVDDVTVVVLRRLPRDDG